MYSPLVETIIIIDNLLILISYIPFDILLYGSNILINFNNIYLFIYSLNNIICSI